MPPTPPDLTLHEILFTAPGYQVVCAFVFVWGLLIGSFLNVCIYRLPLGVSVNRPRRSFCFRCGTPIRWYDNVPVLSLILLGGRDRACGAKVSWRYAFVELLTGVLFLAVWVAHNKPFPDGGFSPVSLWYLVFVSCLIIGTFTDFDHWIIPSSIPRIGTVGALVAALLAGFIDHRAMIAQGGPFPALRMASGDVIDYLVAVLLGPAYHDWQQVEILWWEPFANSVIGAIFAPVGIWVIGWMGKHLFRKDAMGFGDVELFAMIGATVGPVNSVLVLVVASFVGSIVGVSRMVLTRLREDDSPLALGALTPEESRDLLREAMALAAPPPPLAPLVEAPEEGTPDEETLARELATGLEMQFVDLDETETAAGAAEALPAELARRHNVAPLSVTKSTLRLAVENPLNTPMIQEVREATGRNLKFVIASPGKIRARLADLYPEEPAAEPAEEETLPVLPLWKRYYDVASLLPVPRPTHHLPFIPWIATGAVAVVAFQEPLARLLASIFDPAF
ncbi:MAG: leader peptidase (prepilin peptidase) / N-methyltransferase [Candidatus Sumerlaeota bacterium]|nr:leader peptidase (prepilin peptidase) / N-methyltransferase [Candidatus Sumerlaeota bacterium]